MDRKKFSQMLAKFPFLKEIIKEADKETKWGRNFVKFLEDIRVRQADEKLLKAQPVDVIASDRLVAQGGCWLFWGHYFWFVSGAEVVRFQEQVTKDYRDESVRIFADSISGQLLDFLDRDIQYIIEFDHEVCQWEIIGPRITIHEMGSLDWRDLCRQIKTTGKS